MALFDTHAVIKLLIEGGLQEKAAEAVVKAIKESKDSDVSNLASKEQVSLLEKDVENIMQHSATKADLLETEKRLEEKINQSKTEMLKWYIATTLVIIAVFISGLGILFNLLKH